MSRVTFTGSDPIAILGFLTQFRNACYHNDVSEDKAVWLFQHYLAGRALNLIQSRMTDTSLVVDDGDHKEALSTYCEVVNYLLRTFATNEVIATAYTDLTSYVQATGMTETDNGDKLWDKTIRCGSVISQTRLRSMYAEDVLPSIRAQVRNHLATHTRLSYDEVVRYAQALGDSVRAARKPNTTVGFRKPELPMGKPQRRVLSIGTDSVDTAITPAEGDEAVLALSAYTTPVVGSSASSTTSSATSRFTTPVGPTPPSSAPSIQSTSM